MEKIQQIELLQIISLIKSRDEKGLSLLYDNYAGSILGLINNIVRDKEVAEEILQQTMLKVWNSVHQYDHNRSTFFTWMASIARNAAIDKARLKGFQHNKKTETLDPIVHNKEVSHISTSGIDAKTLIGKLDKKYKDVLDCLYLHGYTQKEASEELNVPLGTIKTRLRTAINILREELKNEKKTFIGFWLVIILLLFLSWM